MVTHILVSYDFDIYIFFLSQILSSEIETVEDFLTT